MNTTILLCSRIRSQIFAQRVTSAEKLRANVRGSEAMMNPVKAARQPAQVLNVFPSIHLMRRD